MNYVKLSLIEKASFRGNRRIPEVLWRFLSHERVPVRSGCRDDLYIAAEPDYSGEGNLYLCVVGDGYIEWDVPISDAILTDTGLLLPTGEKDETTYEAISVSWLHPTFPISTDTLLALSEGRALSAVSKSNE